MVFLSTCDVEMLGFRADGQERIPEPFSVQKGVFIITQAQDLLTENFTGIVRSN